MKNLTILEQSVLGKVEPIQQGNQVLVPSTGFGTVVMNSRMPDLGRVKYKKAGTDYSLHVLVQGVLLLQERVILSILLLCESFSIETLYFIYLNYVYM